MFRISIHRFKREGEICTQSLKLLMSPLLLMPSQTLEALLCLDIHLLYEYISLSRFTSNSMYQYANLGLIWEFYERN